MNTPPPDVRRTFVPRCFVRQAVLACSVALTALCGQTPAPDPSPKAGPRPVVTLSSSDVVELSAFEVTAAKDNSYGALNSNSITTFRVELNQIPVSADVFSKAFMEDIAACGAGGFIFEPTNALDWGCGRFGRTHCIVGSKADCRNWMPLPAATMRQP